MKTQTITQEIIKKIQIRKSTLYSFILSLCGKSFVAIKSLKYLERTPLSKRASATNCETKFFPIKFEKILKI
jgi:hypothetical protein